MKVVQRVGEGWDLVMNSTHEEAFSFLAELLSSENDAEIVTATVRTDILRGLESKFGSLHFKVLDRRNIPVGMLNYDTPETLGMDRYLTARGAYKIANKTSIVIDAGTAITVDMIDDGGIFHGGVIMPGVDLLNQILKLRLPELPDPPFDIPLIWPGKSTLESIQWGVAGMVSAALRNYIHLYRESSNNRINLFLTGGDAGRVGKLIDPDLKCRLKPFLLFDGMLDLFQQGQ